MFLPGQEINLKVIDTKKIEGLDISVMKFKSSDDTISLVIEKLKSIVEKGDSYLNRMITYQQERNISRY
jgi:hypothetical protein